MADSYKYIQFLSSLEVCTASTFVFILHFWILTGVHDYKQIDITDRSSFVSMSTPSLAAEALRHLDVLFSKVL